MFIMGSSEIPKGLRAVKLVSLNKFYRSKITDLILITFPREIPQHCSVAIPHNDRRTGNSFPSIFDHDNSSMRESNYRQEGMKDDQLFSMAARTSDTRLFEGYRCGTHIIWSR
jgi:hypothetical protein